MLAPCRGQKGTSRVGRRGDPAGPTSVARVGPAKRGMVRHKVRVSSPLSFIQVRDWGSCQTPKWWRTWRYQCLAARRGRAPIHLVHSVRWCQQERQSQKSVQVLQPNQQREPAGGRAKSGNTNHTYLVRDFRQFPRSSLEKSCSPSSWTCPSCYVITLRRSGAGGPPPPPPPSGPGPRA